MDDETMSDVVEPVDEPSVEEKVESKLRPSSSLLEVRIAFSRPFKLGMLVRGSDDKHYILPPDVNTRQRVQKVKKTQLIEADFDALSKEVSNLRERLNIVK